MLSKYSFGVGDRFAQQGVAQLRAFQAAIEEHGIHITPVWNKSFREHAIIHSEPGSVRSEADEAVKRLSWKNDYLVDADHINMSNVEEFLASSDFFTIDVADYLNADIDHEAIEYFIKVNSQFMGQTHIPGMEEPLHISRDMMFHAGEKFLRAIQEAARIYQYIRQRKGGRVTAEVSIDEVEDPQSPVELFLILSGLAHHGVNLQTIAPKFTGRFNKGVDYVGDLENFRKEFEAHLLVVDFAVQAFGLPANLKLSVHSGSDKFSIYPEIHKILMKHDKGIHVKTAGTTWLEEIAGLALSGGDGLALSKRIYSEALARYDELTKPYKTVIDIDLKDLPATEKVSAWDNKKFAETLRHNRLNPHYNPSFRQLLHVAYKIAAESGNDFLSQLKKNEKIIGPLVTENIYIKHIKPIFIGKNQAI